MARPSGCRLLARHGKVVATNTYGNMSAATRRAVRADALPNIFDDLADYRRGDDDSLRRRQMATDDPVTRYLPELKELKV
jgi:hypothetical protein